jgi:hypothetical protein
MAHYVQIRRNGLTITGTCESFDDAMHAMAKHFGDQFYDTDDNPIVRNFIGTAYGLGEYDRVEVQREARTHALKGMVTPREYKKMVRDFKRSQKHED